jgi:hypothetical protein
MFLGAWLYPCDISRIGQLEDRENLGGCQRKCIGTIKARTEPGIRENNSLDFSVFLSIAEAAQKSINETSQEGVNVDQSDIS